MGQDICNDASDGGGLVAKPRPIHAPPWTVACQAPLSMGFSRWQYCRGLPFPSPEDLPDPGIKPGSSAMQADSLLTELWGTYPIKGYYPKCTKNSYSSVSRSTMSDSLRPHNLSPTRLLCPWDSPGKNTGVNCHSLLQSIFPTQRSNLGLLHCRQILYCLSYREDLKNSYNPILKNK